MQGTIHPGFLPMLLGELYLGGKSGLLRLIKQDESLDCGLAEGRIAFARRRDLRDREALFEALSWDEGAYSFEEQPVAPAQPEPIPDLSMPDLIREAVHRIEDPEVVLYVLGGLDRLLVRGGSAGSVLLTPAEDLVLSLVDGARRVREVIRLVPLPSVETQRSLLSLVCAGVLEARSVPDRQDPVPAELSQEDPEPGHSVPRPIEAADASGGAGFTPAEPLGGEVDAPLDCRSASPLDEARRREAVAIPQFAEAEDLVDNALCADDAIRMASHLMAESDYWGAIRLLDAVIPLIHAKQLKHEAQVLLARAYTKNPKWMRRAEELLHVVVREDPACSEAYFVLGTIYKANGLKARALAMFRKVVELKPDHSRAAAEIMAPDAPSPYKKLFGRT